MELLKEYFALWAATNILAALLLLLAYFKPKPARLLFALLFAWACWINYKTAHNNPDDYLNYAEITPFSAYREFINGWFKNHITSMVTLISIGQGLIALGMLLKSWLVRLAGIGAIIFFLAISPLGIGSGFPATIISSVAIYLILKNDDLDYIWKLKAK